MCHSVGKTDVIVLIFNTFFEIAPTLRLN